MRDIPFKTLAFYFLCAFFATLTFSMALMEINFVLALLCWLAAWIMQKEKNLWPPRSILIPLGLFFSFTLLSAVTSEYPLTSVRGLYKVFKHLGIFLMASAVLADPKKNEQFKIFFLAVMAVVILNCAAQYVFGKDLLRFHAPELSGAGIRLSGSFGTYGKLASFLITTLPIVVVLTYHAFKNQKRASFLYLLILAGGLGVLFLTKSRGAILAFSLGSGIALLFFKKFPWVFAFWALALALFFSLPRNMVIHLDSELKEQSLVERYYLWDRAVHVIAAKPWTGMGINTYSAAHAKYDTTKNWRVRDYYAHNGYLQMAAESGIPCLLVFLWFLAVFFKKIWPSGGQECLALLPGIIAGLFNFLIFSLVDTVYHSPQPVLAFWFMAGWGLSFKNLQSSDRLAKI